MPASDRSGTLKMPLTKELQSEHGNENKCFVETTSSRSSGDIQQAETCRISSEQTTSCHYVTKQRNNCSNVATELAPTHISAVHTHVANSWRESSTRFLHMYDSACSWNSTDQLLWQTPCISCGFTSGEKPRPLCRALQVMYDLGTLPYDE